LSAISQESLLSHSSFFIKHDGVKLKNMGLQAQSNPEARWSLCLLDFSHSLYIQTV